MRCGDVVMWGGEVWWCGRVSEVVSRCCEAVL